MELMITKTCVRKRDRSNIFVQLDYLNYATGGSMKQFIK